MVCVSLMMAMATITAGNGNEIHKQIIRPWMSALPAPASGLRSTGQLQCVGALRMLRLRGGSSFAESADRDIDWGPATATFDNVELLVFNKSSVTWHEDSRGTLYLTGLSSGEPQLSFFRRSNTVGDTAPPATAADDSAAQRETPQHAHVAHGGTLWVKHALWELLDMQPLSEVSRSCALGYRLPAQRSSLFLGCRPQGDAMIGWKFVRSEGCSKDATNSSSRAHHLDDLQQHLLSVQARLGSQRADYGRRRSSRRFANSRLAKSRSSAWTHVEGHGLTPRELELMLNMEAKPLPTEGDDSDVGRTIPARYFDRDSFELFSGEDGSDTEDDSSEVLHEKKDGEGEADARCEEEDSDGWRSAVAKKPEATPGQKIAAAANAASETPQVMCDRIVGVFTALYAQLNVSYDGFVRTTSEAHKHVAQNVFRRAREAGDIYFGQYSGWYNERLESFVPATEAQQSNFTDALTGVALQRIDEASYFFRLSAYQARLKAHIQAHPEFVQPESARNEILQRLEEPLRDLSVSRTSFDWGIPVPADPAVRDTPDASSGQQHVMSVGLPPPRSIFAHGFVTDGGGRKMSKSLGNVVEPFALLDAYGADSVRYALTTAAPWGHDVAFSEAQLVGVHNCVLADGLGNLLHRALSLCHKFCNGSVPASAAEQPHEGGPLDVPLLVRETCQAFEATALHRAAQLAELAVRQTNKYLTDAAPWKAHSDLEIELRRPRVIRTILEALYVMAHLFLPFIPSGATRLLAALGHAKPSVLQTLALNPLTCLAPNTPVAHTSASSSSSDTAEAFPVLFRRLDPAAGKSVEEQVAKMPAGICTPQKNSGATRLAAPAASGANAEVEDIRRLDIRVGKILSARQHPDADSLYVELIELGDAEGPRTIVSGLAKHIPLNELEGRMCTVLCNLKPAKMRGIESAGMLLCGSVEEGNKVELLESPPGAAIGERISVDGYELPSPDAVLKSKSQMKVWPAVAPDLRVSGIGIATYKGKELKTSAGPLKCATLTDCPIG